MVLLLTYPLDSALKFRLDCDSSMLYIVMLLPEPLVSVSGLLRVEVFDKSMVVGCGVKRTDGFDMTTSDGVGDSGFGLLSSVRERT